MKLRIHHQEIRFRLSPKDLDTLETQKTLTETLNLAPNVSWTYSLTLDGETPTLKSKPERVSFTLPEREFSEWLRGPDIEWIYQQAEPLLTLLIEKDLKPHRT